MIVRLFLEFQRLRRRKILGRKNTKNCVFAPQSFIVKMVLPGKRVVLAITQAIITAFLLS
jgi:hypothetical protein